MMTYVSSKQFVIVYSSVTLLELPYFYHIGSLLQYIEKFTMVAFLVAVLTFKFHSK